MQKLGLGMFALPSNESSEVAGGSTITSYGSSNFGTDQSGLGFPAGVTNVHSSRTLTGNRSSLFEQPNSITPPLFAEYPLRRPASITLPLFAPDSPSTQPSRVFYPSSASFSDYHRPVFGSSAANFNLGLEHGGASYSANQNTAQTFPEYTTRTGTTSQSRANLNQQDWLAAASARTSIHDYNQHPTQDTSGASIASAHNYLLTRPGQHQSEATGANLNRLSSIGRASFGRDAQFDEYTSLPNLNNSPNVRDQRAFEFLTSGHRKGASSSHGD